MAELCSLKYQSAWIVEVNCIQSLQDNSVLSASSSGGERPIHRHHQDAE